MRNGKYTLIIAPKDYPGKKYRNKYIYEHHFIWWKNTNSLVMEGYSIHHKNGLTTDNSFKNLEAISNTSHARVHRKTKKLEALVCFYCKKPFLREARNTNFKKNKGQDNFYCCRDHHYKSMRN